MTKYINNLAVSVSETEESELRSKGFKKLEGDLNKGSGGPCIYLWYKTGTCDPITRIQLAFTDKMGEGLNSAAYEKIDKDLSHGVGSVYIYLWFYRGSTEYDVPITELHVSEEQKDGASHFRGGWERLACNLNRGNKGTPIYLFLKRETQTYICDITTSDRFDEDEEKAKNGYIRLDENTNRNGGGKSVFVWYRLNTDSEKAIHDVKISTTDSQYNNYQARDYTVVPTSLNQGTQGNDIYMWFKRELCTSNPIKAITVLDKQSVQQYIRAGVTVDKEDLNKGNDGDTLFLCFNN